MNINLIGDRLLEGKEPKKVFDNPFESQVHYDKIECCDEIFKENFDFVPLPVDEIEIAE